MSWERDPDNEPGGWDFPLPNYPYVTDDHPRKERSMSEREPSQEQQAADELDRLFAAKRSADELLVRAKRELKECQTNALRAESFYKRQALWIRADELRRELAKVEAEAASIGMTKLG